MARIEDFAQQVQDAIERYPECTDGGGDEHFMALVALGQCPYCKLDAEPQDDDGLCPHGFPPEFCGNCHETETAGQS